MLIFLFILIVVFIALSVILIMMSLAPIVEGRLKTWKTKKEVTLTKELDNLFYDKTPAQIIRLYFILPLVLAVLGYFLLGSPVFAIAGALLGLAIPNLILKIRDVQRKRKFNKQILDMIMILSSSLKGGLSLLQALEVVMEEMPAPMSQEVGLAVRENKMGVTLEESLNHLKKRMESDDLGLVVNSILVARETGGDLTKVLGRLSTTIRDNRKLKENIQTLTMQGRLQGIIMSILPFLFIFWVVSFNRHHFDIMLQSQIGRFLLLLAVVLQVIGMILIKKFSTIKI